MSLQTLFRSVFGVIVFIALAINSYTFLNTEPIKQYTQIADGVITEKLINSYPCGEYADKCYDRFFVIDNTMHLVNESTYSNYSVGNTIQLSQTTILNENKLAIMATVHYVTFAVLFVIFVYYGLRSIYWALFKSDTRRYTYYVFKKTPFS